MSRSSEKFSNGMSDSEPAIVIGVPGTWKDRSEITTSIASRSGGYLFAGRVLMHLETKKVFEMDIQEHNPELAGFMRLEGIGQIHEEDLAALENHTFTLYLISDETGHEVVSAMMNAVLALLDSGGMAVKIENAGLSVSATRWRELHPYNSAWSLYRGMVILVGENRDYFTCGMSAFSLPDCEVVGSNLEQAFEVATEFCCYQIDETPTLGQGHTFSTAEGKPRHHLSFETYIYPPGDYRHNPNGIWKLVLMT
ncbi:MAG: DUF4261 domain-containing protein [Verrucomicrobiaceae bacterium]|nr:MAG: DUF4261 domain-containing protein [Verrucomicrobiaceae bacterium]